MKRGLALALVIVVPVSVSFTGPASAQDAAAKPAAVKPAASKAMAKSKVSKRAGKAMAAKAQANGVTNNYNWSGIYGGVNAGYMWGASTWTNVLPPANAMNPSVRQGMLGVHLGVQYQYNNGIPFGLLVGAEFAYSGAPSSSTSAVACISDPTQSCRTRIDNLLTFGGRLGAGYQDFLVFGSGGYAQANVATDQLTAAGVCSGGLCDQQRARGWYAGAGLEYKLLKGEFADVIVGLEWQHIKLNTTRQVMPGGAITAGTRDVDASADVLRARLTWKFNPFGNGNGNGDYKIDW